MSKKKSEREREIAESNGGNQSTVIAGQRRQIDRYTLRVSRYGMKKMGI